MLPTTLIIAVAFGIAAASPAYQDEKHYPAPTTEEPFFTAPPCSSATCDINICYDYTDECGQGYGGCTLAPQCGGPATPTFSKPSCSITAYPTVSTKPSPTACTKSTCYDYANECGQMYGGCLLAPECGGPAKPTFSKPSCTITGYPTVSTNPSSTACTESICYDFANECGQMYGGCLLAPQCGGPATPTFSKPSCTITGYPTVSTNPSSTACTKSICYDYTNECGQMYGGCLLAPECGGPAKPTFSKPPCPTVHPTSKSKTRRNM